MEYEIVNWKRLNEVQRKNSGRMLLHEFSKFTSEPNFDIGDFVNPKTEVKRVLGVLNGENKGSEKAFVLLHNGQPVSVIVGNFFNGQNKALMIKYLVSSDRKIRKTFFKKHGFTPAQMLSLKFLEYAKKLGHTNISSTNQTKLGMKFFQRLENKKVIISKPAGQGKQISKIPKIRRRA